MTIFLTTGQWTQFLMLQQSLLIIFLNMFT